MAKMKLKQIHLTISEELYERLRNVNKYNLSFNKQLTIICINYLKKMENYSDRRILVAFEKSQTQSCF